VISTLSPKPVSWHLPYVEALTFSIIVGVIALGWLHHSLVRLLSTAMNDTTHDNNSPSS
jgi:hypothetical protein